VRTFPSVSIRHHLFLVLGIGKSKGRDIGALLDVSWAVGDAREEADAGGFEPSLEIIAWNHGKIAFTGCAKASGTRL
jgi:hypothetical protein